MFQLWVLGVKEGPAGGGGEGEQGEEGAQKICSALGAGKGLPRGLCAPEKSPGLAWPVCKAGSVLAEVGCSGGPSEVSVLNSRVGRPCGEG